MRKGFGRPDKRKCRLLILADLHCMHVPAGLLRTLRHQVYDVVIFLGDIPTEAIEEVIATISGNIPAIGVCGNHDRVGSLEHTGVFDLHAKTATLCGYTFAGLEGSFGSGSGYGVCTQEASLRSAASTAKAEILISHESQSPSQIGVDTAHAGLKGITSYVRSCRPWLHLHGHHHIRRLYQQAGVDTVCCYGVCIVELKGRAIANIDFLLAT